MFLPVHMLAPETAQGSDSCGDLMLFHSSTFGDLLKHPSLLWTEPSRLVPFFRVRCDTRVIAYIRAEVRNHKRVGLVLPMPVSLQVNCIWSSFKLKQKRAYTTHFDRSAKYAKQAVLSVWYCASAPHAIPLVIRLYNINTTSMETRLPGVCWEFVSFFVPALVTPSIKLFQG